MSKTRRAFFWPTIPAHFSHRDNNELFSAHRHNIKDDERQSLYDAANDWMSAIQRKGTNYLGGDQPNLADISVFGVLSSIEGCRAFQDLRKNTSIGNWFDNMKKYLETTKGRVIPLKA